MGRKYPNNPVSSSRCGVLLVDSATQSEIGIVVPVDYTMSYSKFKSEMIREWRKFTTNYANSKHIDGTMLEQFIVENNQNTPLQIASFGLCIIECNEKGEIITTE